MKIFGCSVCQQVLFFENTTCTRCGHALAYLPEHTVVSALEPVADASGEWIALAPAAGKARVRLCRNYTEHAACSWAVPAASGEAYCRSCRFNDVIPDLGYASAKDAWQRIERAKRRLVYTLF